MVELPTVKKSRFRLRSWVTECSAAIATFFLAFFVSIRLIRDPGASRWEWLGTTAAAAILLAVNVIKAVRTRREEMKFEPLKEPDLIVGWAHGLHDQLCEIAYCDAKTLGVRIVVYKVIWDRRRNAPEWLEQIISYVGDIGGPPGRRVSARAGIIGRVARLAELCEGRRVSTDVDAYRDELVGTWGFTEREAHETSASRWSWFAVPLLESDQKTTYGVVYVDARTAEFFENDLIKNAIVAACAILARTARMAYNRAQ
jgi:hypothetical protein